MSRFSQLADWLRWQETLHPSAIDLGLDRMGRTLERLAWKRPACPIVTVGGTNGKGSCVALLNRILASAGYRVGTFTSPHLVRYNERITIEGREIADAPLVAAFERIDGARGDDTLTFFEFNTLAALLAFETADLDAIVLEVGMGGRLDSVNIADADVAVVTSIALDHCDWLGPDVETIGREKAGIFRAGRPAIFGSREMPSSIETEAQRIGAQLLRLGVDFDFERYETSWDWRSASGDREAALPPPALFGRAQYDNASAVLQALRCLEPRLPVTRQAIETGLRTVKLAGRFQIAQRDGIEWVLDVAHNPAAARTLAEQLRSDASSKRTLAVCGILADKDVEGIAQALQGCFEGWVIAGLEGPRALKPEVLAVRVRTRGAKVLGMESSVQRACARAQASASPGDRIVVFGSFLSVGPALEWLESSEPAGD